MVDRVSISETFKCRPEQFFSIITDYEKYPDFMPEVKGCRVVRAEGERKLVEYSVSLIKKVVYRLWMEEKPPHQLLWIFDSGDLFRSLEGLWELSPVEGGTQGTYSVHLDFKLFIPGFVGKKLMNVHLPNMMKAHQDRVNLLF